MFVVLLEFFKLLINARFFGVGEFGEESSDFLSKLFKFRADTGGRRCGSCRFNIDCCRRGRCDLCIGLGGDRCRHGSFAANGVELIGDIFQAVLDDVRIPVGCGFADVVKNINSGGVFLKSCRPVRGVLGGLAVVQEDECVRVKLARIGVSANEVDGDNQQ